MTLTLRPYQEQALRDLDDYWMSGKGKSPCIVLPTGSGKSLVIAEFIRRVLEESPHVRIMVVVHSREIVKQNFDEFVENCPSLRSRAGIYSAGLHSRDTKCQIIFAGIQSIYNKVFKFPKIDIVTIDEAHCIPRSADTRYGKFLKDIHIANPNVVVWGCTASPFRTREGLLTEGKDRFFDGIAHVTDLKTLIAQGYLVPVISVGGLKKIDLTNVHIKNGDYAANELARAADDPEITKLAVEDIVKYGKDRPAWIVYCAGINHAEHVAIEIRKHGFECKVLTGDTPMEERDKIIGDFKSGKLSCICNVGVLITGFNAPITSVICLLFSTISVGKYIQVIGRGCRTYPPSKENVLILDYGGNIERLGLLDEIDAVSRKDIFNCEKALPPMKPCPECRVILHARVMKCPHCGYDFPLPDSTSPHGVVAYAGPVTSDQVAPFIVDVKDTWISRHKKSGKPDSVKVAFYDSMEREYPMWLALNSDSPYAVEKSRAIVKQFGGTASDVDGALKEYFNWKQVDKIQVRMEGRFPRILGFVFKKNQSTQQKIDDGGE